MLCAAVAQVVAIHAGDDHVSEFEQADGVRQVLRFVGIGRQRLAVRHIAERTAARAHVAKDHEAGRAFAEAFADVGAGGFLAHGVQLVFAQHALHFVVACAAAGFDAYPLRFAQAFLQGNDLDRIARGFGGAGLFVGIVHRLNCKAS